jgi:hypothetical protein
MLKTVSSDVIHRIADDGRADNGRRLVSITQTAVLIERHVGGVKMRVSVPVTAYVGLVLARRAAPAAEYAIILSHRDPELCIEIDAAADCASLTARMDGWARYFGKPAHAIAASHAVAQPRGLASSRRPAFLARRKPGVPARTATVFQNEDEIISYE